jgi:hypothetical protein
VRQLLKNRFSGLIAWLKRHPLIGTALGLFLVYLAYEFCTTFLVICRDVYVTADIVTVAPQVSGPMLHLAVTDNQSMVLVLVNTTYADMIVLLLCQSITEIPMQTLRPKKVEVLSRSLPTGVAVAEAAPVMIRVAHFEWP